MTPAFAIIDLDNVLGQVERVQRDAGPAVEAELDAAFACVSARFDLEIMEGQATMNPATDRRIPAAATHRLRTRNIHVRRVSSAKESVDKDLFQALGVAQGRQVKHFVIISGDGDFAQAAGRLLEGMPDAIIVVVARGIQPSVHSAYRGLRVQLVDLGVPFRRPDPSPAPAAREEDEDDGDADTDKQGQATLDERLMLVCQLCGTRRLVELSDAPRRLCHRCGNVLISAGQIAPEGAVPYIDGPLIRVSFQRRARLAVAMYHTTTIGCWRGREEHKRPTIDVAELQVQRTLVSEHQASILAVEPMKRYTVVNVGTRNLFRQAAGRRYMVEPGNEPMELRDGDVLWINDPGNPNHADGLVRISFHLTPPARA